MDTRDKFSGDNCRNRGDSLHLVVLWKALVLLLATACFILVIIMGIVTASTKDTLIIIAGTLWGMLALMLMIGAAYYCNHQDDFN